MCEQALEVAERACEFCIRRKLHFDIGAKCAHGVVCYVTLLPSTWTTGSFFKKYFRRYNIFVNIKKIKNEKNSTKHAFLRSGARWAQELWGRMSASGCQVAGAVEEPPRTAIRVSDYWTACCLVILLFGARPGGK